jgi:hypothetical protein
MRLSITYISSLKALDLPVGMASVSKKEKRGTNEGAVIRFGLHDGVPRLERLAVSMPFGIIA